MAKNKVLLVITKGGLGGAQKHLKELALYLSSEYEVEVVSGNEGELTQSLNKYNIKTHIVPEIKNTFEIKTLIRGANSLSKIIRKENFEIVHAHSSSAGLVSALAVLYCRLIQLKSKPKFIFTVHGWAFNEERPFGIKSLLWILQMFSVATSNIAIAVSHAIKDKAPSFFAKKMNVIYNGIEDFSLESKSKARSIIDPRSKNPKEYWFGIIAELNHNKGVDVAIKAFKNFADKDHKLIIIGGGVARDDLEKLSAELNLTQYIKFTGPIPDASKLMKAFDLLLMPSRTEAMPYVPLEAGIAKVPIIASAVGGIPEIIENFKEGILVRPNNVRELIIAISHAVENPLRMRACASELYKKVTQKFKAKKSVSQTLELYKKLF